MPYKDPERANIRRRERYASDEDYRKRCIDRAVERQSQPMARARRAELRQQRRVESGAYLASTSARTRSKEKAPWARSMFARDRAGRPIRWSDEDTAKLIRLRRTNTVFEIALALGRSPGGVYLKVHRLKKEGLLP